MAREKPPGSGGRMLFTDFDPSGKGQGASPMEEAFRPPRDDAAEGALRPAIPTLDELAAAIDIDFEDDLDGDDDGGSGTPRHSFSSRTTDKRVQTPSRQSARRPAPRARPAARGTMRKQRLAEGEGQGGFEDADDRPESFSDAPVERKRPRAVEPLRPAAPDAPDDNDADDDDILSSLPTEDSQEWRGRRLGMPPPRLTPYGGLERLGDWFRPPEGSEEARGRASFDAADMLEGAEDVEEDGLDAERRPDIPPPRAIPFGGLDRLADWFRPPEELESASGENRQFAADETGGTREMPPVDEGGTEVRESAAADGERPGASHGSTRGMDIFRDLDLEGLWREKVAQGRDGEESPADSAVSGRAVKLFANLELDSLWEKKQAQSKKGAGAIRPNETVIMSGDDLNAASTVIMQPMAALSEEPPETVFEAKETLPSETSPASSFSAADNGYDDAHEGKSNRGGNGGGNGGGADDDTVVVAAADAEDAHRNKVRAARAVSVEGRAMDSAAREPSLAKHRTAGSGLDPTASQTPDPVSNAAAADAAAADAQGGKVSDQGGEVSEQGDEAKEKTGEEEDYLPGEVLENSEPPEETPAAARSGNPAEFDFDAMFANAMDAAGKAAEEKSPKAAVQKEPVAINPADVFSELENMDFSDDDGLDDDMKALLEEDAAEAIKDEAGAASATAKGAGASQSVEEPEVVPTDLRGKIWYYVRMKARFVLRKIAWRENWRFYCNLLASVIASASMAVIISYFLWYR